MKDDETIYKKRYNLTLLPFQEILSDDGIIEPGE